MNHLEAICKLAHNRGMTVIVDSAHRSFTFYARYA